jgi:putative MATE family efflux protein
MQDKHGLLTGSIPLVLRQMTVPMTFGMVAIFLFNLVDTFFVSMLGTQALAAISFTFPVTFIINSITMGIGIGISTQIGYLMGRARSNSASSIATHGILLAVVIVSLTSMLGLITLKPLFIALGAEPDTLFMIHQYMSIWYCAVPLLVIPMAGNSVIRATGDTKTPAKIMILSGVINGVLDPIFIFGFGPIPALGIKGAALASAISWLGASCYAVYILVKREKLIIMPNVNSFWRDSSKLLKISIPATLSNTLIPISGAIFIAVLSQYGTEAVAAFGAAQRIESILLLVLMSLTSALTPFIAQNMGANNPSRSFAGLFMGMRFAIIFQTIIFLMIVPLSSYIASLFSQDGNVKTFLWQYLLCVPLSYGFQGVMMMLVSGLNALKKPINAFLWSCARLFIFMLPCALIGSFLHQVSGLFLGIAVANILGGITSYCYAIKLRRTHLSSED